MVILQGLVDFYIRAEAELDGAASLKGDAILYQRVSFCVCPFGRHLQGKAASDIFILIQLLNFTAMRFQWHSLISHNQHLDTKLRFASGWFLTKNTILVQNISCFLSFRRIIKLISVIIITIIYWKYVFTTQFEGTAEGICGLSTKEHLFDRANFQKYKL